MKVGKQQIEQRNAESVHPHLLQRLRAKDEQAFRELMDRYGDEIIRVIYLLTKDHHLAEDICQETFVTVFEKIEQFNGKGTLKGWMMTIAVNHCRARMRKAAWKRLFYKDLQNEEIVSKEQGPEEASVDQSLIEQIHKLSYKYREVIVLHYYQDLPVMQISEQLGESLGTVKSRLSRARAKLKDILQKGGWHE